MNACKRMKPVAELAQQQADAAAQSVAECNRVCTDIQKQLDELLSYRDGYANGLCDKGRTGLNAIQIKDYRLFLVRLNKAIEQQQLVLNSATARLAASRQVWVEKQQHAKAIDSVVGRYQQQEQRERSRRDQHESDEHAQRMRRSQYR
jgi:flagellar FliJ protein